MPVILFGFAFGEYGNDKMKNSLTFSSFLVLLLACVVGLGISFAGFHARKLLSATSFTVLGVSNKIISIVLSLLFLTKYQVNMLSMGGLLLCISCGTLYAKTKSW